jgi:prophage DNA circulation protein
MFLETYFLISTSIAATLVALILAIVLVQGILVTIWLRRVLKKVERVTETAQDMAAQAKEFVHTTSQRFMAIENMFLTVKGIREVADHLAEAFHRRRQPRTRKRKEVAADGEDQS